MPIRRRERHGAVKLLGLGGASQRGDERIAAGNYLGNFVEVPGADKALVRDGAVAEFLRGEFFLLKFRVRRHACLRVAAREMEHGHVERMEPRQRDELELVPHFAQYLLEAGDSDVVELFLPVKRGRTVVSQEFAREFSVNRVG